MQVLKISIYLLVFTLSNFIVLWFGAPGLIITALLLIPFDFVMRSYFHESWSGVELILKLGGLVLLASLITYLINQDSIKIATASVCAFLSAQITAGVFYQVFINKPYFYKVNGSDVLAIITDSIVFQIVAFEAINYSVTTWQIILKIIGGFFWYYILFVKLKIQNHV